MARMLILTHTHALIQTGTHAHTQCWTVSPFKQERRGRKHIMAKQKAPERQLVLAYEVTMDYVCFCEYVCVSVCKSVHTCQTVCVCVCLTMHALQPAVCIHASLLICSPIKHTPLVCALQLSLFSCPKHTRTRIHTHWLASGLAFALAARHLSLVSTQRGRGL